MKITHLLKTAFLNKKREAQKLRTKLLNSQKETVKKLQVNKCLKPKYYITSERLIIERKDRLKNPL